MTRTLGRTAPAAVVALLVVAACNDSQNPLTPKPEAWSQPPASQPGELFGLGFIGSGTDVQNFAFDVKSQRVRITGLFLGSEPSTSAVLITDPVTTPGTSFTAFRNSSSFCANSSHGAEFDAVGRLLEPGLDILVTYTVKGCDNGPGGLAPPFGTSTDKWSVDIPSRSYHKDGVVNGDIRKQCGC